MIHVRTKDAHEKCKISHHLDDFAKTIAVLQGGKSEKKMQFADKKVIFYFIFKFFFSKSYAHRCRTLDVRLTCSKGSAEQSQANVRLN